MTLLKRGVWGSIRWGLAVVLTLLAIWLSIRQVEWTSLRAVIAQGQSGLLILALGSVLATTLAKAARWLVLLQQSQVQVNARQVLRALFIGQMGNSILPARLGDVGRVILLGPRTDGGVPVVLGTILEEKALDGFMGLLILLGLALGTPLPDWLRAPILLLGLLTASLLGLLALASTRQAWARRLVQQLVSRVEPSPWLRVKGVLADLGRGLGLFRKPTVALRALAWSVLVWGLAALTNVVVLEALAIQTPAWSIWLVLVSVYVANFLPAAPAQIGIFEYACILALSVAGVEHEAALAFGLVLHLLVYGPPLVLGPLSMAVEGLDWAQLRQKQILEQDGGAS